MKKDNKIKLLIGMLLVIIGALFLVFIESPGISFPIFILFQSIILYLVIKDKRIFIILGPMFLMSLNFLISSNDIWKIPIIMMSVILYSVLVLLILKRLEFKNSLFGFVLAILENLFEPLRHFSLPFNWLSKLFKGKSKKFGRVVLALIITLPILIVLLFLLASADMIFGEILFKITRHISIDISVGEVFRMGLSIVTGLYFFGICYSILNPSKKEKREVIFKNKKPDLLIINIVTSIIIFIYTIFIIIQFRYLFAGGSLPYGLSYSEYARKGFFELLALTGFNLGLIIFSRWYLKNELLEKIKINKIFLNYLLTITVILLISSFYRMYLYSADYGLTRLRLYVFGFLVFEMIGLIFTYFYLNKQKINIIAVYSILGLGYFILLNIVPTDRIIAKNLIDRYYQGELFEIEYVTSLSYDAAPEIVRLKDDIYFSSDVYVYFKNIQYYEDFDWRSFNIAIKEAHKLGEYVEDKSEFENLNY